jgi:curved DNA-binding protein CbpA
MSDHYRTLEVDPQARVEVVHAAYKVLAKLLHPDISGRDTTRDMAALNVAYDVLRDPVRRAAYDRARQVVRVEPDPVYMSFGKHKGQPITSVPTAYLLWCHRTLENEDYLFDVTQELVRRGAIA